MDSIRLSALGREVHVGDFYNYFNDNILPGPISELKQNMETSETCELEHFFFFRLPNKYKRYVLGINSHLDQSIEGGSIDIKRLWFGDYLEQQSTPPEDTAQVDVIFRIIRRTEVLNQQHFDQPKMFEHQQISGGKATHLVEKVVYGVELIISMRRTLDLNFESKSSAEGNIYLAAKSFFQTIGPRMKIAGERLSEFKRIKCTIFSSLESRNVKNGTFEDSCKLLQDLLRPNIKSSIYSDKEAGKWKPIEIILKFKFNQKLSAEIKARLLTEKMSDVEFEVEKNLAMVKAIIKESNVILKHPSIHRAPPFEMAMCQFLDLLVAFQKKIDNFYSRLFVKTWSPEQIEKISGGMKSISDLLMDTTDWLIHRRKEIEIMCSLLSKTHLPMSDLKEIKSTVSSCKGKCTKDINLKMDYTQDPLIDNLAKYIQNQKAFKLPVFWIVTSGKNRTEKIIPLLKYFDNLPVTQCSSLDCSYQIGLVPVSSSLINGAIIPFGYPVKDLPTEVPAAELPDKPIQPSGNSEKGQQVETSITQEISRVFSGSQIGHPPADPQDYYVSEKSPIPPKRSNSSLSENWKMNSGCAAAPMKMVSSHHPPTEIKGGFSSSEVKIELKGNGTNISDSSLTRSEVFPKLCSIQPSGNREEGHFPLSSPAANSILFPNNVGTSVSQESFYSGIQIGQLEKWDAVSEKAALKLCLTKEEDSKTFDTVSSITSRPTTSLTEKGKINSVCTAPAKTANKDEFSSSEREIELSSAISSRENLTNLPRKQKTLFDLLSQCFPCLRKR